MQTYNRFVDYYDEIVRGINSPLTQEVEYLDKVITSYNSGAKKILEFACGTGVVSKELINKWYKVIGLDINENMLLRARKNIWDHNVVHWNMINYDMEEEFDIVLCNYNSICHLIDFEDWKKTFLNALESPTSRDKKLSCSTRSIIILLTSLWIQKRNKYSIKKIMEIT